MVFIEEEDNVNNLDVDPWHHPYKNNNFNVV